MDEALILPVVDKLGAFERKLNDLQQIMEKTHSVVEEIRDKMRQASYPAKEMQQLSNYLDASLRQLRQPMQQRVVHHHHATKLMWTTVALFLVVCLLTTGWYMTSTKLICIEPTIPSIAT